ncbi:hypothetical protein BVI1335_730011 [Burkholderia vietnamiensis]|nr:hypothetical protein BVI1335_730011 [Burkholderia vietnamiensis]
MRTRMPRLLHTKKGAGADQAAELVGAWARVARWGGRRLYFFHADRKSFKCVKRAICVG